MKSEFQARKEFSIVLTRSCIYIVTHPALKSSIVDNRLRIDATREEMGNLTRVLLKQIEDNGKERIAKKDYKPRILIRKSPKSGQKH